MLVHGQQILVTLTLGATCFAASIKSTPSYGNEARRKVILDNDFGFVAFLPILQALHAGWNILGIASSTGNTWALQSGLHALALLEIGGLDYIPVYKGSDYPLLNHPGLLRAWEDVHGKLPYEGVFAPENGTREAEGHDPTSGNSDRIVKATFVEGYPNITFDSSNISAAEFMVQQVRRYPGQVTLYAAGSLTNIALACRLDSSFARNAQELVVMGGYIDANLLQVTGSNLLADLQSDINLKTDPEASKIALTADFPNIILVGNVANEVFVDAEMLDEFHAVNNVYTDLFYQYYLPELPLWDETAAAVMLDRSLITNGTEFYVDVDTSYWSPNYGQIHAYQEALAPRAQPLRKVQYVLAVNASQVVEQIRNSLQYLPSFANSPREQKRCAISHISGPDAKACK